MLWRNSKKTWKSSLMVMELNFDYGFELSFDDECPGGYKISFHRNYEDISPRSLGDQVISLN